MTNGEAINWIINISADIGKAEHRDLWHYEQALSEIREMLEDAPTIEQEQRWIPCSERLPEHRLYVLVTYKYEYGLIDNGITWYSETENKWNTSREVIAWMPLPEPYTERRTDEADYRKE